MTLRPAIGPLRAARCAHIQRRPSYELVIARAQNARVRARARVHVPHRRERKLALLRAAFLFWPNLHEY
eukprot:658996-Pleurochrysis_carterae.AAC.2